MYNDIPKLTMLCNNTNWSAAFQAMSAAACFMIDGEWKVQFFSYLLAKSRLPSVIAHDRPLRLFSASVELTRDFCEQLDGLVGPQLTLLASDICEQFTINRRISGSVVETLTIQTSSISW